jgi:hypothetical protein
MLDVHLCIKQGTDFLTAPDGRQLAPHLGLDDLLIEPGLLQCPRVEELQSRSCSLNGSPVQLPFVEQIQKKCADVLRTELIRSLVEVLGKLRDGVGVVADRAHGEVP